MKEQNWKLALLILLQLPNGNSCSFDQLLRRCFVNVISFYLPCLYGTLCCRGSMQLSHTTDTDRALMTGRTSSSCARNIKFNNGSLQIDIAGQVEIGPGLIPKLKPTQKQINAVLVLLNMLRNAINSHVILWGRDQSYPYSTGSTC